VRKKFMPIGDPFKRKIAQYHLLYKTICRKCGALNPYRAKKCRRCHCKDMRNKKREVGKS
jgi:large subunit ribosomal protein L40e